MTDKQNPIVNILVKYALKQELSEEEQRLLDEWRARSGDHADLPDQLRDPEWRQDHQREIAEAPTAAMWEKIRQHIRESKGESVPVVPFRRRVWRWVAAAAAVGTLIGGGWFFSSRSGGGSDAVKKASLVAMVGSGSDITMSVGNGRVVHPLRFKSGEVIGDFEGVRVVRTDNGVGYAISGVGGQASGLAATHHINIGRNVSQAFQVSFPDGSQVWLDTNTRFAFAAPLRGEVEPVVEGQAFFQIAPHDPGHPLRIWTGKGEMLRILGTSFTVRSYAGEAQGKVELYTGKVQVHRKKDSLLLAPDQLAVMTEAGGLELQKMGPHGKIPVWTRPPAKSPYFEFQNTPLSEALHEVAVWYGQNVFNPDHVEGVDVTGKLPRSESLEHTLQALQQVQGWHAVLKNKADTIYVSRGTPGS
jgi:ferric-dicitrate binding protein FerR (iron transport regulator)